MRSTASLGLLLTCLAAPACRTTGPPVPPRPVNAVLSAAMNIYGRAEPDPRRCLGDTRLTTRFRSQEMYAQHTRGNWTTRWYAVRFDVVSVDHGMWSEPELSFICSDRWPTPESGITISVPPWPYKPGAVWIFELDTRSRPALVIDQYTPPDGKASTGSRPADADM